MPLAPPALVAAPAPTPTCTATPSLELAIAFLARNGSEQPVLHFTDPNDPGLVSGYNVYRASNPAGPWTRIGFNAADADGGTARIQFVDTTGSSGGPFFYQVAAFYLPCNTEGPWISDIHPPSVTIDQAAGQADPTNGSPVNFTVTFNEAVTGFGAVDVSTSGSTATVGTITVTGSNPYSVAIAASGNGSVVATVVAGAAQDAAGNPSLASTSSDNGVVRDVNPPTVTINQAAGQADPTNGSPVNFTVTFSEAVTGFGAADVSTSGSTATVGTISVTGSNPFNVAIAASGNGSVVATVVAGAAQDAAGNSSLASTSSDNSVVRDITPPTVVISSLTMSAVDSPTFAFNADEPATFFCKMDAGAWSPCTSPKTYTSMPLQVPHTFSVYAQDATTQAGPAASRSWLQPPPNVSGGNPYVWAALGRTLVLSTISLSAPTPHPSHPNPQATNRITYVQPGAPVNLNLVGFYDYNPGDVCSGCIIQFHVGIAGVPIYAGGNLCLGSGVGFVAVNASTAFSAPMTAGVYILNPLAAADFSCNNSHPISPQFFAESIATLVVLP